MWTVGKEQQPQKAPKLLYHYTTFEGLKGILKTEELWFSERQHVNDTKEFCHLKQQIYNVIQKCLKQWREGKTLPKEYKESDVKNANCTDANFLCNSLTRALRKTYLFSFCVHEKDKKHIQNNGLLSMWRGYGEDGGYAFVFDFNVLKELFISSSPSEVVRGYVDYLKHKKTEKVIEDNLGSVDILFKP